MNDQTQVKAYGLLLKKFAQTRALREGRNLHAQLSSIGYDTHTFLGNQLVLMYGNCGCMQEARSSFDKISQKNSFSWNILLTAHAQNEDLHNAREIFRKCPQHTLISTTQMITGYTKHGHVDEARELFEQMPERCIIAWNAMMVGYAQNGHMQEARIMFHRTPVKNIVSWNALLTWCGKKQEIDQAIKMFNLMPQHDLTCWNSLLAAYTLQGYTQEAMALFREMPEKSIVSVTAMIEVFSKAGKIDTARNFFERMPQRDVVVWTTMVTAYAQGGHLEEARELFDQMPFRDGVAWSAILAAYKRKGNLDGAMKTFTESGEQAVSSWNTLIGAFTQKGQPLDALNHFRLMDLEGIRPNNVTYSSVIDACANLPDLSTGRLLHTEVIDNLDVIVITSLVNMYARCGILDVAFDLFVRMPSQDIFSWNTMISAYAQNGRAQEAAMLLRIMVLEGVKPDKVSFLSVLSACSHEGLAEEGWTCFVTMREHEVPPDVEHYVCMIDTLGRVGRLEVAGELIKNMPFEPKSIEWRTLLGACRVHEDAEQAASVAEHVLEHEKDDSSSSYVLLSHIYSINQKNSLI